jgi:hypothetical protein
VACRFCFVAACRFCFAWRLAAFACGHVFYFLLDRLTYA